MQFAVSDKISVVVPSGGNIKVAKWHEYDAISHAHCEFNVS